MNYSQAGNFFAVSQQKMRQPLVRVVVSRATISKMKIFLHLWRI